MKIFGFLSGLFASLFGFAGASEAQYRGGSYGELSRLPKRPGVVIHFIPCLEEFLSMQEDRLGRKLSESEYRRFRDMAPAIQMDAEDQKKINRCNNPMTYQAYLDGR
ncbi:MAG: hypothetical protein ACRDBL_12605 [Rhabdaerophilum sp.]